MISKQIFEQSKFSLKPLREFVQFLDNRRKPVREKERIEGPYPYYGANGQQGSIDSFIFDEPTILLAEDGGHFENPDRGIAYKVEGQYWVNNHAHVLKPNEETDINFLCHALKNHDVTSYINGTTRAKLTKGNAERILLPSPPLEEQKRIASILDAAEELRQKRQRSLELLDELKQAIFWETFFQSKDGTKTRVKLAEVVDFRSSQVDPKRQPYSEMLHVGPEHIASNTGEISWQNVRTATEDGVKSGKYKFESGDLIYSKIRPYLNKVAVADREGICSADMYALHNPQKITIEFLHFLLMSNDFLNYAETLSNRANIPKLNRGQLSGYEFDLPSKVSLQVFSKKMENLEEVAKQLLLSTTKIDELFTSLQHKAFAGELSGTAA